MAKLSSSMYVSFEGVDELVADMNKVTQQAFGEAVQGAVKLNGSEMQQEAKAVVPVDTGDLKRSIQLDITDNGFTAEVQPNMHYRNFVEYGTRYMLPQPYMRPSFAKQEPKFKEDMDLIPEKLIGK